MRLEDIDSRRYETYWRVMDTKKGRKRGGKKGGGGAKKVATKGKKKK